MPGRSLAVKGYMRDFVAAGLEKRSRRPPPAASAIERAPNRMKTTPTSLVTATPWVRKNRRTS
jgi:hypothetical protein